MYVVATCIRQHKYLYTSAYVPAYVSIRMQSFAHARSRYLYVSIREHTWLHVGSVYLVGLVPLVGLRVHFDGQLPSSSEALVFVLLY